MRQSVGNGELWWGDCLELMADIPDGSVDMILCDLPYGTTQNKWDAIIPFEPLWAHYWRVAKPNAAIVLTAAQPFTTMLIFSQMFRFKYCWVWRKSRPSGFAQARNMPLKDYEDICVFSTGVTVHASQSTRRMPYHPQGLVKFETPKLYEKKSYSDSAFAKRPSHRAYEQNEGNFPRQVIDIPSEGATVHPTQKPVALFEYLIRTYTNPGELVLDNCSGSGTTAVAAQQADRRFICIEQDVDYYLKSVERVAATLPAA